MAVPRWIEKLFMSKEELAMEKSHEEWKRTVVKENAELKERLKGLKTAYDVLRKEKGADR